MLVNWGTVAEHRISMGKALSLIPGTVSPASTSALGDTEHLTKGHCTTTFPLEVTPTQDEERTIPAKPHFAHKRMWDLHCKSSHRVGFTSTDFWKACTAAITSSKFPRQPHAFLYRSSMESMNSVKLKHDNAAESHKSYQVHNLQGMFNRPAQLFYPFQCGILVT